MIFENSNVTILTKKSKPHASIVHDTYWKFSAERQEIFFKKLDGKAAPWTDDIILLENKFTNVYRAADRVSQFLIKHVIYEGPQESAEILFRILLFKTFNKIETWKLLQSKLGSISWAEYSFNRYADILKQATAFGEAIYSGAYIMASGKSSFGYARKYENHLKLIERILNDELDKRIIDCSSMQKIYETLITYPTIGKFLGYQYTIDINYSILTNFSEMDFVVPGPGATDGIRKCFLSLGDYSEADVVKFMADSQELAFEKLGLKFKTLWGRPLQLIDCQNIFCEVDKYSRVAHPNIGGVSGRKRIKQKYQTNGKLPVPWYPPKWGINSKIEHHAEGIEHLH